MTGIVRRVALAVLGVSFILLAALAQQRLVLVFIRVARVNFAVLVAIWLLPLLVAALVVASSRTGRSLLSYVAASLGRRAAALVAVLGYMATLIPTGVVDCLVVTRLALSSTGAILLIYASQPPVSRWSILAMRRVGAWLTRDLGPLPFLLLVAGFTFASTNLVSWLVFHHIPHVQDSINQVFQGRVFASGRIVLPARLDDYFFNFFQIYNDGQRVFAVQPFGHSLLLALGTLIHAEWLVNPVLGAAEIVVVYLLGKEIYDEKTGRIAALLGAISPFLLFMSSEYMNHASALLSISLFVLFFFRTIGPLRSRRSSSGIADPLLGGLCLAMALNIRPLTAVAVSAPVAVYSVFLIFRSRGRVLGKLLLLALPVVLGIGAFALYNHLTTGRATLSGYEAYGILQHRHPGFGVGFGDRGFPWWPGPHTPTRGVVQTASNLVALNRHLFEGPLPGLILVLVLFLTLPRNPADYVLLALFVSLPVAYFFYFFQGLCFGPRLLYEGLAPLLLLSARGLVEVQRLADQVVPRGRRGRATEVVFVAGLVSLAVTAGVGLPRLVRVYASSYWGVNSRVHEWIERNRIRNAVVFVSPTPVPEWPAWAEYYGSGFLANSVDFNGPVVCARDRGVLNYLLMCRFPGRTFYHATWDTICQIVNPDSLRLAPTIQALAEAGRLVGEHGLSNHRTVLLPFREAGALVDTTGLRCRTYRNLDYALFRDSSALAQSAPALGVFLADDENKYSPVFEPMRQGGDYVAAGCRFVPLFRTEDEKCAVYDIRAVARCE
jgi:hypothetical protein